MSMQDNINYVPLDIAKLERKFKRQRLYTIMLATIDIILYIVAVVLFLMILKLRSEISSL